jgi:hypothetical protein
VNKHRFPGGQTNGQSQTNKQTDTVLGGQYRGL